MKRKPIIKLIAMGLAIVMGLTQAPVTTYALDEIAVEGMADEVVLVEETTPGSKEDEVLITDDAVAECTDDIVSADFSADTISLEVNQGLSKFATLDENALNEYDIDYFVANKKTALMFNLPVSNEVSQNDANIVAKGYSVSVYVSTGNADGNKVFDSKTSTNHTGLSAQMTYDRNGLNDTWMGVISLKNGLPEGKYNIYLYDNKDNCVAARVNINFTKTNSLKLLVVPVTSYYSIANDSGCPADKIRKPLPCDEKLMDGIDKKIEDYLMDVYPVSGVNVTLGTTLNLGSPEYDLCNDNGMAAVYDELKKLVVQDVSTGKNKYDLVIGFVMYYQGADGTAMGYTYGKGANIVTLDDKCVLSTVAHEMAHGFNVGDEYGDPVVDMRGSFNPDVNPVPNGYKGWLLTDPNQSNVTIEGTAKYWRSPLQAVDGSLGNITLDESIMDPKSKKATGTIVYNTIHPYELSTDSFVMPHINENDSKIFPIISWMGTGYDDEYGYYWVTSPIWQHLMKVFMEKKTKNSKASSNVALESSLVEDNTSKVTFLDEDDFYYMGNHRSGFTRMMKIKGRFVKNEAKTKSKASDNVSYNDYKIDSDDLYMASFDGSLDYVEDAREELRDGYDKVYAGGNVYSIAAIDKDGKIVKSELDGKYSWHDFTAYSFNRYIGSEQDYVDFDIEAEFPKDAVKYIILRGTLKESETDCPYNQSDVIWTSDDVTLVPVPEAEIEYASISVNNAAVKWTSSASDAVSSEIYYVFGNKNSDDLEVVKIAEYNGKKKKLTSYVDDERLSFSIDANGGYVEFVPNDVINYNDADSANYDFSDAFVWIRLIDGISSTELFSNRANDAIVNVGSVTFNKKKEYIEDENIAYTFEKVQVSSGQRITGVKVISEEEAKKVTERTHFFSELTAADGYKAIADNENGCVYLGLDYNKTATEGTYYLAVAFEGRTLPQAFGLETKIIDAEPKVTVKQTDKFNLFYKNSYTAAKLTIKAEDNEFIAGAYIKDNPSSDHGVVADAIVLDAGKAALKPEETEKLTKGLSTVITDNQLLNEKEVRVYTLNDDIKLTDSKVKTVNLKIKVAGYKAIEKKITLSSYTNKPKYSMTNTNIMICPETGVNYSYFEIQEDKKTVKPAGKDSIIADLGGNSGLFTVKSDKVDVTATIGTIKGKDFTKAATVSGNETGISYKFVSGKLNDADVWRLERTATDMPNKATTGKYTLRFSSEAYRNNASIDLPFKLTVGTAASAKLSFKNNTATLNTHKDINKTIISGNNVDVAMLGYKLPCVSDRAGIKSISVDKDPSSKKSTDAICFDTDSIFGSVLISCDPLKEKPANETYKYILKVTLLSGSEYTAKFNVKTSDKKSLENTVVLKGKGKVELNPVKQGLTIVPSVNGTNISGTYDEFLSTKRKNSSAVFDTAQILSVDTVSAREAGRNIQKLSENDINNPTVDSMNKVDPNASFEMESSRSGFTLRVVNGKQGQLSTKDSYKAKIRFWGCGLVKGRFYVDKTYTFKVSETSLKGSVRIPGGQKSLVIYKDFTGVDYSAYVKLEDNKKNPVISANSIGDSLFDVELVSDNANKYYEESTDERGRTTKVYYDLFSCKSSMYGSSEMKVNINVENRAALKKKTYKLKLKLTPKNKASDSNKVYYVVVPVTVK